MLYIAYYCNYVIITMLLNNCSLIGYAKAKDKNLAAWDDLSHSLTEAGLCKNIQTSRSCSRCGIPDQDLLRCIDCNPWMHLCQDCICAVHPLPHLHIFEKWRV